MNIRFYMPIQTFMKGVFKTYELIYEKEWKESIFCILIQQKASL